MKQNNKGQRIPLFKILIHIIGGVIWMMGIVCLIGETPEIALTKWIFLKGFISPLVILVGGKMMMRGIDIYNL